MLGPFGTSFYRAKRFEEWTERWRTNPVIDQRTSNTRPADMLIFYSKAGLFRYFPAAKKAIPLEKEALMADKFDYLFTSRAEVDGEEVNLLRRTPKQKPQ